MRHELLGLRAPLAVVFVPNMWIFVCILCMRLALLVFSISTRSIFDLMPLTFLPRLPHLLISLLTSAVASWASNL